MKTEEKKEFWCWPFFLFGLVIGTIMFYKSIQMDKAIWATSEEVSVTVFDKQTRGKNEKRIYAYHDNNPIYVKAGSRWFRQAKVGSTTLVRYSSKYNAYIDRYHKFDADEFFLVCMIVFDIVILWRAVWLGMYVWYWKD